MSKLSMLTDLESQFIIDLLNDLYSNSEYEFERSEILQAVEILSTSMKYDMTSIVEKL
jgi:hypothetical protein